MHPHDLDFMNAPTGSCTGLQEKCTDIYYESTRAHKRYPYCCPSLCFAKSKSS